MLPEKESFCSLPVGPCKCWKAAMRSLQNFSLFQAEQIQLPQLASTGEVLQSSEHYCGHPLDPLQQLHILTTWGSLELKAVLKGWWKAEQRTVTSLTFWSCCFWNRPGYSWFSGQQALMLTLSSTCNHSYGRNKSYTKLPFSLTFFS